MSNIELKPCPFCGEDVMVYYSSTTNGYFFTHKNKQGEEKNCILLTPAIIRGRHRCLKDAYDAWNRRANNE